MNKPTPTDKELLDAFFKNQERMNLYMYNPAAIMGGLRDVYFLGLSAQQGCRDRRPRIATKEKP